MFRALLFLVLLSFPALAGGAAEARQAYPGEQTCPVKLPDNAISGGWNAQELWAWEQICLGGWADLSQLDEDRSLPCQPVEIERQGGAVPATRLLRREFLQLILTQEPWVGALVEPQVLVYCARIEQPLDLENQHVKVEFFLDGSNLQGGAELVGARFDRALSFQGSVFGGEINADRLQVGASLFLRGGGEFKGIRLLRARIEGDLDASGSRFSGSFNADGLQVGGVVFVNNAANFQDVILTGATINGTLDASGSSFASTFSADRTRIGGGVFLNAGATFDQVRFPVARIEGDFDASGSEFNGLVNASGFQVSGNVFLNGQAKFHDVNIIGAVIGATLDTSTSTFAEILTVDRARIGGVFINYATFQAVSFAGVKIESDFDASGSEFAGNLNAEGLQVGGSVYLNRVAKFQGVSLLGATTGGTLDTKDSTFADEFVADRAHFGGGVFVNDATFSGVRFAGATIDGDLDASGSGFGGLFVAEGVQIAGNMFLRGGSSFQDLQLSGAAVGAHLQLAGSEFGGVFDLSGARIGELVMFLDGDPVWGSDAVLVMRNTSLTALQSRAKSWQRSDGGWIEAELTGLTYDRLSGFGAGLATTLIDADVDTLIGWIEQTRTREMAERYDPGPYEQLAAVLAAEGLEAQSDAVLHAKFDRRSAVPPADTPWWERAIAWPLSRALVGYGIYPSRAGYGFALIILAGWLMARWSTGLRPKGPGYRFWYSVDIALPIVCLKDEHGGIEHGHLVVESFYHFQRLLGLVIASYLVGALTLPGS